jgi:hypothetical protein
VHFWAHGRLPCLLSRHASPLERLSAFRRCPTARTVPLARPPCQATLSTHANDGDPYCRAYRLRRRSPRHRVAAHASQLIDHVKYLEPQDVKPPEDDTELRRARAPRGPSLRSFVKLALKCDGAEELGKRL